MSKDAVHLEGITRDFGAFRAVDNVDLSVPVGSIHSVIGPNGAGKSTLFKMITGVLRPTSGKVYLAGADITGRRPNVVARNGLVEVFQMTSVFPLLTVTDAIGVSLAARNGQAFNLTDRFRRRWSDAAYPILEQVGIGHLSDRLAGEISHGDQRALELAMTLATSPNTILLDEPTAGMSPAETAATTQLIVRETRSRGLTVLLSEHDMNVVFGISDWVTVLHLGRVIAEGPPEQIRSDPQVLSIYLGQKVATDDPIDTDHHHASPGEQASTHVEGCRP